MWFRRAFVPFCLPIAAATVTYFATLGPVLHAAGGESQDLERQVEKSVVAARQGPYDVLFLGNSRVARGVDPKYIQRASHNFAFDDDTFLYYLPKYRDVVRAGVKVKVAVVGVDAFQLGYWNYDRYFAYRAAFCDPALDDWLYDRTYGPSLVTTMLDKKVDLRFAYRAGLVTLASRALGRPTAPPAESYVLEPTGFYRVTGPSRRHLLPTATVYDPRLAVLLEEVVRTLRQAGVEVVLFSPPASAAFRAAHASEMPRRDELVHRLAAVYGARIAIEEAEPAFSDDDFPDDTHLSVDAAARYSRELSASLEATFHE